MNGMWRSLTTSITRCRVYTKWQEIHYIIQGRLRRGRLTPVLVPRNQGCMTCIVIGEKIDPEIVTVLPRGTLRKYRVWMKRKKTLEWDAVDHGNKLCHLAHDDEQQQQAAAAAATAVLGMGIQVHTRTSCQNVRYYNKCRSGPGILLWNSTRCLRIKKERNDNALKDTHSSSSNMHVYKADFSIA